MNAKELLEKAKVGQLTELEAARIAAALESGRTDQDRYTLIHALGRAEATRYRPVIEKFLDSPQDPMLAGIALTTLCTYWDLTAQYLPAALRFARGVPWDEDEDVRLLAISILGEHARTKPDIAALRLLVDTVANSQERALVRRTAHESLARAAGQSWEDSRKESAGSFTPDPALIDWALGKIR